MEKPSEIKSARIMRALSYSVRRLRDSNPRYLAVRRFSRPVRSTNSAKPPKSAQIYVKQINLFHFVRRFLAGEAAEREPLCLIWDNMRCNHVEFNCLAQSKRCQMQGAYE